MLSPWGFTGRAGLPERFEEQYHCYSVAYADKAHLEGGDKILLPPSAFDTLARLQVDYPMLFQLQSPTKGTMTHCGVLEFTAEEGSCYVPFWMMQNLLIEEGAILTVTNVSLPKATFVKLRPQHVDFLEITNPRAVLEHALRNFSCVTKGDVICVPYNGRNYHFELREVQPQDAACIIETDCNVDFDAPVGYKEPGSGGDGDGIANGLSGLGADASSLANLPKQSPFGTVSERSSACPSPAPSSSSGISGAVSEQQQEENRRKSGIRIVDGKVIRPDDDNGSAASSAVDVDGPSPDIIAKRTGATGVQRNAAIPVKAPEVDYWAVAAGEGARLDGKKPAALKDRDGNEIDVRKLRAEAAAKRAAVAAAAADTNRRSSLTSNASDGTNSNIAEGDSKQPAVVSKRRSRVGSKYSRLKQSGMAFEGAANTMK